MEYRKREGKLGTAAQKKSLSKQEESLALEIYVRALELPSDQRKAFLEANAKSSHIQYYVENLLSENTRLASFLAVAPDVSNHDLTSGEVIGNFRVRRTLGKGGLATVYLAHDLVLNRLVALKVSDLPFPHEGRLLANLDHPHIVRVYSQSDNSEHFKSYLCMQFVPGLTLGKCIETFQKAKHIQFGGQRLIGLLDEARQDETVLLESGIVNRQALKELDSVDMVLHIGAQLADALHYAHQNQVLHLDIKPENVIINRYGQPMLMDFNVSIDARPNANQSLIGGTFHYMSPEQKKIFDSGEKERTVLKVDARSDIYSLGLVLKEFLDAVRADRIIPSEVKEVLEKATASAPQDRYQSTKDLREALTSVLLIRSIERRLPKRFFLGKLTKINPFLKLGLWGFIPIIGANTGLRDNIQANIFPQLTDLQIAAIYSMKGLAFTLLASATLVWLFGVYRLFRYSRQANPAEDFRPHLLSLSIGVAIVHWLPMFFYFGPHLRSLNLSLTPAVERDLGIAIVQSAIAEASLNYIFGLSVFLWDVYPKLFARTTVNRLRIERDLKDIPRTAMLCFFAFVLTPWLQANFRAGSNTVGSLAWREGLIIVVGILLTFVVFNWLHLVSRTVDIYLNQGEK